MRIRVVGDAAPKRAIVPVLLLVSLYLLGGFLGSFVGGPYGFGTAVAATAPAQGTDGVRPAALFPPPSLGSPLVSSGSNIYYVGAQAPTSICNPTCTYVTNTGARTTVQVISTQVTGCLSYWIGDDSAANIWAQVGYYICSGATPLAFYQIWNLTSGAALTTGTTSVSTGYHTFSLYVQSGTTWAFALDGTAFGTYNLGASLSLGTYPVQAVSEEGLVSGPWTPPEVTFSTAIQTLQTSSTFPTGNGWIAAPSAFDPWGGCTSSGAVNNTGGYTCWGLAGNLQDTTIQANSIVTGGSRALLRAGTSLWSGSAADFTLTASPSSVTMNAGTAGTSTLTVAPLGGFTGTVALTTSISPATGLSCSLTPSSISGGSGTSTLSCSGSSGTYTVTVTGTSGSLSHATTVSYTVSGGITLTFSFMIQGGGTGYTAPTLTYVQGGTLKTATLTGTATAVTVDANSAWSVTNPLAGSSSSERWQTAQTVSGTATSSLTAVFTYYHQVAIVFGYSVLNGGSGYASPAVSYVAFGATTSAATGTSVWSDVASMYAFPVSLPGSTSSEAWRTNNPSGTIAAPTTLSVTYYHQFSVAFAYTVLGGGNGYTGPAVSTAQFGVGVSLTPATAWVDAGAAYAFTNPLAGSSSTQRWTSAAPSGTVSSTGTVTVSYYHQYQDTFAFTVLGGGSGYTGPSVSYASLGVSSSTPTGIAVWADAGAAYRFQNPLPGSSSTETWTTGSTSGSVGQSGTYSAAYYHQFQVTFVYQVTAGGTGYSAPSVSYASFGITVSGATGTPLWADAGGSYAYPTSLPGSTSSEAWRTNAAAGTVTASTTILVTYYHEYAVTFGYTVQGGGSGYTAPAAASTQFGGAIAVAMGVSTWIDASSPYTLTNPLGGSTASERWMTASASGTVTSSGTLSAGYVHQFAVSFAYALQGGGTGYAAPTATYQAMGTSASAAMGATVWADAGTSYALTNPLGGSTSTAAWRSGTAAGSVSAAGTISATYYYQFLVGFLVQVLNGNPPSAMPTLSATVFGSATTLTAGGSSWVDAGGAYAYPASFAGSPGERWMSANPATGTVTLSATITAAYYDQDSVTFAYAVSGGGSGYGAPSVTYAALGSTLGTTAGATVWADAGSAYVYATALPGGTSAERWITPSPGGTVTGAGTSTVTYINQLWVDFTFTVKGGGSGYSAPSVTYSNLSISKNVLAVTLWVWADAGTTYTYQNPLPGSTSSNSWQTNNGVGTTGASATYSATYRHQYKVKFSATTLTGAQTPQAPQVNVTVFGANVTLAADNVTWVDAGGMYSFPGVFYGPLPGERWITSTPPSGLVLGPMNITATYAHQYYLAIQINAAQGGTVTGTAGWYDEAATMTLQASAEPGWQFQGWIGSGSGSYSGSSTSASIAMDAPVTETAVFYVGLTLSASNGGSLQYTYGGTSGWVPAGSTETLYMVPGTSVTLEASPSLFYQLDGWSGSANGGQPTVTLVANAPQTLTATYGLSLYSKVDSLLSLAVVGMALLALGLGVRRRRRKRKERAIRLAMTRARARA